MQVAVFPMRGMVFPRQHQPRKERIPGISHTFLHQLQAIESAGKVNTFNLGGKRLGRSATGLVKFA